MTFGMFSGLKYLLFANLLIVYYRPVAREFDEILPQGIMYSNSSDFLSRMSKLYLFYKVQCFIRIPATDKTDNLTCEIIYDNFTCENYCFSNHHQS